MAYLWPIRLPRFSLLPRYDHRATPPPVLTGAGSFDGPAHITPQSLLEVLDAHALKLNELIDAVNAIQQFINLQHPTQPPFPPLILPTMDEIKARLETIR